MTEPQQGGGRGIFSGVNDALQMASSLASLGLQAHQVWQALGPGQAAEGHSTGDLGALLGLAHQQQQQQSQQQQPARPERPYLAPEPVTTSAAAPQQFQAHEPPHQWRSAARPSFEDNSEGDPIAAFSPPRESPLEYLRNPEILGKLTAEAERQLQLFKKQYSAALRNRSS